MSTDYDVDFRSPVRIVAAGNGAADGGAAAAGAYGDFDGDVVVVGGGAVGPPADGVSLHSPQKL